MKNLSETGFLSLLQDESFINKVKEADNHDDVLNELILKYPDHAKEVKYSVEFILANLNDLKQMQEADYDNLLNNILNFAKEQKRKNSRNNLIINLGRVAAILIFAVIASTTFYFRPWQNKLKEFAYEIQEVQVENQSVIVLSDGTKRILKKNDSFIEYGSAGEEVIVKSDKQQAERIENRVKKSNPVLNQIAVPFGQRQRIRLSDGSIVQLNAGSKLVFPATFSERVREVYLIGEGFFDVTKDEERPFIVKTDYYDVRVLGTTFNISAYSDEKQITTVLVEGKVKVSQKDKLVANEEHTLHPGQACFYSVSSKNSIIRTVNIYDYISWKDGLFQFRDMPLTDVVSRVIKYYNKQVSIEGDMLGKVLVSGKLVLSDDISEVMQSLSKTIEGHYELTSNNIYVLKD